ncbi:MAG: hypothetical protein HQK79_13840 [Desulfobacterales bacterium]|nr:hypothetical protein [Desulfobacterales bacterium]
MAKIKNIENKWKRGKIPKAIRREKRFLQKIISKGRPLNEAEKQLVLWMARKVIDMEIEENPQNEDSHLGMLCKPKHRRYAVNHAEELSKKANKWISEIDKLTVYYKDEIDSYHLLFYPNLNLESRDRNYVGSWFHIDTNWDELNSLPSIIKREIGNRCFEFHIGTTSNYEKITEIDIYQSPYFKW